MSDDEMVDALEPDSDSCSPLNPSSGASGGSNSALRHNIETKGKNAYYYAHNRDFHIPQNAKVVTGPGIITGGAPQLLSRTNEDGKVEQVSNIPTKVEEKPLTEMPPGTGAGPQTRAAALNGMDNRPASPVSSGYSGGNFNDPALSSAASSPRDSAPIWTTVKSYMFVDEKERFQVILDLSKTVCDMLGDGAAGEKQTGGGGVKLAECKFHREERCIQFSCELQLSSSSSEGMEGAVDGRKRGLRFCCEGLKHAISVDDCKYRVSGKDNMKVTLTCKKAIAQKWGELKGV